MNLTTPVRSNLAAKILNSGNNFAIIINKSETNLTEQEFQDAFQTIKTNKACDSYWISSIVIISP